MVGAWPRVCLGQEPILVVYSQLSLESHIKKLHVKELRSR